MTPAAPPLASTPSRRPPHLRRLLYLLPLLLFLGMAGYFWSGLGENPHDVPSVLIGQPLPAFTLAPLEGREQGLSSDAIKGQVALINVFGSWCVSCRLEHTFLERLKTDAGVPIYGIDWREKNRDAGPQWLKAYGDPYTRVGDDPDSRAAIALGVTGAPETFVVDRHGVIRYKQVGPITPEVWQQTLAPLIERLRAP
jgi:cytochrome c biogenesis protein CcmG/thiol:disulfide interchange protein DsbE